MKELYSAIIIGGLLVSACESDANANVKVEPENRVTPGVVAESETVRPDTTEEKDKITPIETEMVKSSETIDIENFIHRQMDSEEYQGEFAPAIKGFFGDRDIRGGFCGPMALLSVLDFMSMKELNQPSGVGVVELVNKYFVNEFGKIKTTYKEQGLVFASKFGMMSPTSLYWMLEEVGNDLGMWNTELVYGTNDFVSREPVKKSEMEDFVNKARTEIFNKDGVLIMHVIRKHGWNGKETETDSRYKGVRDYHFVIVLNMEMNADGTANMLIVDSMGVEGEGFFGWVNTDNYTTAYDEEPMLNDNGIPMDKRFSSKKYSGILSAFGMTPTK